ncbi:diacylglycerol kinase [Candidatus Levyibacteriota bacterium]|nr:diacylglycerol kinase family protein [Candidatus Levybacteria bacterium]MSU26252.1 diacylglycerol kinase family protein [Candidatus Levybacteria bacterium]GDX61768.1 diacylglycerol kinase [Candidatus Levybacteria bacterium]
MDIKKLIDSFGYAWEGVIYAVKNNQNMWIHVFFAVFVVLASILFEVSSFERGILGVMILLVIAFEMINTAIEQMVDLITKEHKEEAKIAKDVSAGMVLVTMVGSVIIGCIIFIPYVINFLNNL